MSFPDRVPAASSRLTFFCLVGDTVAGSAYRIVYIVGGIGFHVTPLSVE
jgi:hypothetical protein